LKTAPVAIGAFPPPYPAERAKTLQIAAFSHGRRDVARRRARSPGRRARRRSSAARRAEAHPLAHVGQDLRGDRTRLLGTHREHPLKLGLVGAQLRIPLAHGSQVVDHGLGDGLLEVAVARALELALDLL